MRRPNEEPVFPRWLSSKNVGLVIHVVLDGAFFLMVAWWLGFRLLGL